MNANYETYEKVANHCKEFLPIQENDSFKSSANDCCETISCVNCKHFTESKCCNLDLYDQICANHNFC